MKTMREYCIQDVAVLEQLFERLKPFAKNIPNYNLFEPETDKKICPSCGQASLVSNGWRRTKVKSYRRYQCKSCKSWSRSDFHDERIRSI